MKDQELKGEKDTKNKVLKNLTQLESELNANKSDSYSKVMELKSE